MVLDTIQPSVWRVNHNGDTRLSWKRLSEINLDNSEAFKSHPVKIIKSFEGVTGQIEYTINKPKRVY